MYLFGQNFETKQQLRIIARQKKYGLAAKELRPHMSLKLCSHTLHLTPLHQDVNLHDADDENLCKIMYSDAR